MQLLLDFDGRRLTGARPFAVFESKNGAWRFRVSSLEFGVEAAPQSGHGEVLTALQAALLWAQAATSDRGAAIGFFSYDFARQLEPRAFAEISPFDDLKIPDIRLVFFEELLVAVERNAERVLGARKFQLDSQTSTNEYDNAIARIREYIAAGDVYQANYTERFSATLPCSPAALYEKLNIINPAPFAALLEWDDFAIVSNSPERFLKLEGDMLIAQPIKGTIERGSTQAADKAQKNRLLQSVKNRAENVMIVDLLRNDLGRVCEYGSIKASSLCDVQTFPTLHHLVSTVTGVLRAECDALDAFAAAFPCGSITGAPKFRAMQIIDELETTRRGASFGAIGFFGFDGDMEWNVAIRTLTCHKGMAHFHAGGGIVWDSNAQDEHSEMQLKAAALQAVLSAQ
jgi:para-aminobenzoate synthetase component 1